MLLTFEKIRETQLNERSGELQKLPEGFFKDVVEYLKLKSDTEEGLTAQKILLNLFERRIKKVASLASICYNMDKIPDNMDGGERELYTQLSSAIKSKDIEFKKKMMNVRTYEKPYVNMDNKHLEQKEVILEGNGLPHVEGELTEDGNSKSECEPTREVKVKVRFTKDTPELMTPDMETQSFKACQEIELSKGFADFLIKKGFAEKMVLEATN